MLKLVCIDLCGSFSTPSFFGSTYFMTFINDLSRKTWVYFLKKKLDALSIFKTFNIKIKKHTWKIIKVFRLNNGVEFISSQFTKYCQDNGIRRQFSQAYTPQHNGVIERKNWIIVERTRSILLKSRLPTNLWTKVVNTTNYVVNCSPFRAN